MTKFKYVKLPHTTDTWLTPPDLLEALGPFDMDPCCPPFMPWRTARRMIHRPHDGLALPWRGRVWCNPPYSKMMPWVDKMRDHGNGILLAPAKSTDSRWGQTILSTADAVLFFKGRLLFHFVNGERSSGKWMANLLAAWGGANARALKKLSKSEQFSGTYMVKG